MFIISMAFNPLRGWPAAWQNTSIIFEILKQTLDQRHAYEVFVNKIKKQNPRWSIKSNNFIQIENNKSQPIFHQMNDQVHRSCMTQH